MLGATRSRTLCARRIPTAQVRHRAARPGFALPAEYIHHHNGNHQDQRGQSRPPGSPGLHSFFIFVHEDIIKGLSGPVFRQRSQRVMKASFLSPAWSGREKGRHPPSFSACIPRPVCYAVSLRKNHRLTAAAPLRPAVRNAPAASAPPGPTTVPGFPGRLCPAPERTDPLPPALPDPQWRSWAC